MSTAIGAPGFWAGLARVRAEAEVHSLSPASGADGPDLEVVGCAVGEPGYVHSKDIGDVGPGCEGSAGLNDSGTGSWRWSGRLCLDGTPHVSVTCASPRAALKLVGAEMLGVERTVASTCADQALMTPAELTARPW